MSGHQGWLERPYQEGAALSEADERARELGYEDAEEWAEDMKEQADLDRAERQKERDLWDD